MKNKTYLLLQVEVFESTVRLAKSNGDTWAPIFLENSQYILEVMDTISKNEFIQKNDYRKRS